MTFEGVNIPWVRDELITFLEETAPEVHEGRPVTTKCTHYRVIELMEIVKPILDRLYPNWVQENPAVDENDHFNDYEPLRAERYAAIRLIVRLDRQAELIENLGGTDTSPQISATRIHPLIWEAASAQWSTGHRHEAVLAAAKAVNSLLQTRTGRRDISEAVLVQQSFSGDAPQPGKPRLRFNHISNDQTAKSMRTGVSEFGAGCFGAIRNPIGHLPNNEVELDEQSALERLCALSLLARWIDEADLETA